MLYHWDLPQAAGQAWRSTIARDVDSIRDAPEPTQDPPREIMPIAVSMIDSLVKY
jgi:hypothetical protein